MAIVRIWRARMRGTKLQRFKETMIMQRAWQKWLYRLSKEGAQSGESSQNIALFLSDHRS